MRRAVAAVAIVIALTAPAAAQAADDPYRYLGAATSVYAPGCSPSFGFTRMDVAGMAYPAACRIEIDPTWWAAKRAAERCTMLVHEVGHLAGADHQADPRHVMHPDLGLAYGPHPACRPYDRAARVDRERRRLAPRARRARQQARSCRPRPAARCQRARARARRLGAREGRLRALARILPAHR